MDETVEEGAKRELYEETNVEDVYLEQFHVFSTIDRDPRERVLTVAFFALISKNKFEVIAGDDANKAQWYEWNNLPLLAFDHAEIIKMAREKLQEKLRISPIAFKLLNKVLRWTNCNTYINSYMKENMIDAILCAKWKRLVFLRKWSWKMNVVVRPLHL